MPRILMTLMFLAIVILVIYGCSRNARLTSRLYPKMPVSEIRQIAQSDGFSIRRIETYKGYSLIKMNKMASMPVYVVLDEEQKLVTMELEEWGTSPKYNRNYLVNIVEKPKDKYKRIENEKPPPSSDSVKFINGYSWNKLTEIQEPGFLAKTFFLRGVVAGIGISDSPNKHTVAENFFAADTQTLIKGLDKFYDDYRNINIPVALALEYVSMEIKGYSRSEIDKKIQMARKIFCGESK
jgi:hypothetical protein